MQIVAQGSPERNSRVLFTVSRSLCIALSDFQLLLFNTYPSNASAPAQRVLRSVYSFNLFCTQKYLLKCVYSECFKHADILGSIIVVQSAKIIILFCGISIMFL